eukprot:4795377-Lingulodinium_polyedra.AAC.1
MVEHCRGALAGVANATDIEPVDNGVGSTCVRAGLLGAWREAANDPDKGPGRWCREGAPSG